MRKWLLVVSTLVALMAIGATAAADEAAILDAIDAVDIKVDAGFADIGVQLALITGQNNVITGKINSADSESATRDTNLLATVQGGFADLNPKFTYIQGQNSFIVTELHKADNESATRDANLLAAVQGGFADLNPKFTYIQGQNEFIVTELHKADNESAERDTQLLGEIDTRFTNLDARIDQAAAEIGDLDVSVVSGFQQEQQWLDMMFDWAVGSIGDWFSEVHTHLDSVMEGIRWRYVDLRDRSQVLQDHLVAHMDESYYQLQGVEERIHIRLDELEGRIDGLEVLLNEILTTLDNLPLPSLPVTPGPPTP